MSANGYTEIAFEDRASGLAGYLVVPAAQHEISFGGTRVDPSVTRKLVAELADTMSLKLAGHGASVGGAKAGVRASPDDPRLSGFLAGFAEECAELLRARAILGKDMGAKQWMLDQIYASLCMPQLGLVQQRAQGRGCPAALRDLTGYVEDMTGLGAFWSIQECLDGELRGARVLIQGFGVVGKGVARRVARAGGKVIGVSDREKAVLGLGGLDVGALVEVSEGDGLLRCDASGPARKAERDALLVEEADVLVLAAGSYLIDETLAPRIRAPLVVEAANLALTPSARASLHARRVRVVPDVVASSSSAALVGHQIAAANRLDPSALWERIEATIRRNTRDVDVLSKRLDVDSKSAFARLVAGAA